MTAATSASRLSIGGTRRGMQRSVFVSGGILLVCDVTGTSVVCGKGRFVQGEAVIDWLDWIVFAVDSRLGNAYCSVP